MDYVEENPDNYKSLVRGAASGDAAMRAIFDETRGALAARIVAVLGESGLALDDAGELAVQGWVAFAEECVIRWLENRSLARAALEDMLAASLPGLVLAIAGGDVQPAGALATGRAVARGS